MGVEVTQRYGSAMMGLGVGVCLAVASWFATGPDHVVFAFTVQCGFVFMALLVGPVLVDTRRSRYRVRVFKPRLYTFIGAELVRRFLDVVGWNRIIGRMRQSESGASMRARFLRGGELSKTAHLLGAAATVALSVIAVVTAHFHGAWQVLIVGFILHGYPVMIQRIVRFRITNRRVHIEKSAS